MSYLAKTEQPLWRQRLQRAYQRPEHEEAVAALTQLHDELEDRNQSAARSLAEGLNETLTLHRLGLYGVLGRSLKTTNCLESHQCACRRTLCEGRSLAELKPTPPLAGDRPPRDRAASAEGDGLSSPPHTA